MQIPTQRTISGAARTWLFHVLPDTDSRGEERWHWNTIFVLSMRIGMPYAHAHSNRRNIPIGGSLPIYLCVHWKANLNKVHDGENGYVNSTCKQYVHLVIPCSYKD